MNVERTNKRKYTKKKKTNPSLCVMMEMQHGKISIGMCVIAPGTADDVTHTHIHRHSRHTHKHIHSAQIFIGPK